MPLRNCTIYDVTKLLRSATELGLHEKAKQKLQWFRYAIEHGNNVSLTCRHFDISRSTFLRWALRFDPQDVETLDEQSRSPLVVRIPETDEKTIELIRAIRMESPLLGKKPICALLRDRYGITISTSTVGRIIQRHRLFYADTKSHIAKRMIDEDEPSPQLSSQPVAPLSSEDEGYLDDPFLPLLPGITS